MIQLEYIRNFYTPELRANAAFQKHIVKEYLQLQILDFLSTTHFIRQITFIGGTNLRLVKGIDRFSEDLDFDCKNLTKEEFGNMTDAVIQYLQRSGLRVEARDKENDKLKAFRRSLHFPELLFELNLTGHKEERFLIKMEVQDQLINYQRVMTTIKGCGMFFSFPVPTDEVLCAMKLSAMLSRQKGRDFYDAMFLLAQAKPDYNFLSAMIGIHNLADLKTATKDMLKKVDLSVKMRDFEHLLFNKSNAARLLLVEEFFESLK
jgi:predicted nucleotidyltransferase component of viral defense system